MKKHSSQIDTCVCVTGRNNEHKINTTLAKMAYDKICICKIWLNRKSPKKTHSDLNNDCCNLIVNKTYQTNLHVKFYWG